MKKGGATILIVFGVGAIIIGIGSRIFLGIEANQTMVIVQIGSRLFDILSMISLVAIGIGVITAVIGITPKIRKSLTAKAKMREIEAKKRAESQEENQSNLDYMADRYDPDDIRRWLKSIIQKRPDVEDLIREALSQMDSMDHRQEKLKELLDVNRAEFLRPTMDLLDEVEQFICKNFRKVINRDIITEVGDDKIFAEDKKYQTYTALIKLVLEKNRKELDQTKKFLADLVELIDEKAPNPETTLLAWMEIIRDSLKREEVQDS